MTWADAKVVVGPWWVHCIVPIPPSGDAVYRVGRKRIYPTQEWVDYQAAFRLIMRPYQAVIPFFKKGTPLRVDMVWCRKHRMGDLSNRKKTIEDAVQRFLYENDSEVIEQHAYRFDTFPGLPRVEIIASDAARASEAVWDRFDGGQVE